MTPTLDLSESRGEDGWFTSRDRGVWQASFEHERGHRVTLADVEQETP